MSDVASWAEPEEEPPGRRKRPKAAERKTRREAPRTGVAARFAPGPRSIWQDVPDEQWNDWRWQQRKRITRLDQLEQVIRVSPDERRATVETAS